MINNKSLKWCFGVALSLGLASCSMDDFQRQDQMEHRYKEPMQTNEHKATSSKPKAVQKTYASKDPTQQATPGPARKAAPQIPVIQ